MKEKTRSKRVSIIFARFDHRWGYLCCLASDHGEFLGVIHGQEGISNCLTGAMVGRKLSLGPLLEVQVNLMEVTSKNWKSDLIVEEI